MAETYTHDFNISLGEDGSKFMVGSFNVDKTEKKTKQKVDSSSDPLPLEFLEDATKLIRQVADLLVKYDGVKEVIFKQKPQP